MHLALFSANTTHAPAVDGGLAAEERLWSWRPLQLAYKLQVAYQSLTFEKPGHYMHDWVCDPIQLSDLAACELDYISIYIYIYICTI